MPKAEAQGSRPAGLVTQTQSSRPSGHTRPRPKAEDQLIKGLDVCKEPHLKAPVLSNSNLVPAHRALQGLLAL